MNQWEIDLVKNRFEYLNLSGEQASKVLAYEKLINLNSENYSFSQWEEFDFEEMNFRSFLRDEQMPLYLDSLKKRRKECQIQISESDAHYEWKISLTQQKLLSFTNIR